MKKVHPHKQKFGSDPAFDWYFSLRWFAIALVIVIAVDTALFIDLTSPNTGAFVPATQEGHIDRAAISNLASNLRAEEVNAASLPSSVFRDPMAR